MVNLTCSLKSAVLRKMVHLNVILPDEKLPESGKFPVVWLLHGLSDDDSCWNNLTSVSRYARELGFAVVMPDGGRSFYADMACGPKYWSFISKELFTVCRNLFPLSDRREENFVAGLSMGGYGALKLALNHPEYFAGCAAFSAVADILDWLGNFAVNDAVSRTGSDLFELISARVAEKCELPAIFHACGSEDFLIDSNRKFRDHLEALGVEKYQYLEEPGVHNWEFWDRNVARALNFFKSL